MARGKSSIVFDVKNAINEIDRIGQSKRDLRKTGQHGIHSLKQKKETISACQNFAKWVRKEHGVKRIYDLREEHYREYIADMKSRNLSNGHIMNVETALRHLQKGMNARSERFNRDKVVFIPKKRLISSEGLKTQNRSYSDEEYLKILKHSSKHAQTGIKLMRHLGLRVREATNVEVQHFKQNGEKWVLKIENGSGITKGGRFREVPVPKHFEKDLVQVMKDKSKDDRLVPVKTDTLRKSVNRACKKANVVQAGRGTHGFRHLYSRERIDQLFKQKGIIDTGPNMLERILENRENGRKADYSIFTEKDKRLYLEVKQVVDQVHSELGHGKDRWDLAMVYMKG